jgi:hypothetical protein
MRQHRKLAGDPAGYVEFDLGRRSFLHDPDVDHRRLPSTAEYHTSKCAEGHDLRRHRYSISKSLIESDVLLSPCNLKVHRKAGTALSQKNLAGTTSLKEWLPHHRYGSPAERGDLFEDRTPFLHRVKETLADFVIRSPVGKRTRNWLLPNLGLIDLIPSLRSRPFDWHEIDWYGNDTIWRTLLDLNSSVFHGNDEAEVVLLSSSSDAPSLSQDVADQIRVQPGSVLSGGWASKVLSQDLRIKRGDWVIVPMNKLAVNSLRRLQLAILQGAPRAIRVLFETPGRTMSIRWRNLRVHDLVIRPLLAVLLVSTGAVAVGWQWVRYRVRIRRYQGGEA